MALDSAKGLLGEYWESITVRNQLTRRRESVTRNRLAQAPNKAAVVGLLRDAGRRAVTAARLVRPLSLTESRRRARVIPAGRPPASGHYPKGYASLAEALGRTFRRAPEERREAKRRRGNNPAHRPAPR